MVSNVRWKFIINNILTILLVFWAIVLSPYINLARPPVLLSLVGVFIILLRWKDGDSLRPGLLDTALLGLLAALAVTTLLSIEPHRSWIWTVGILGGLVLMLAVREVVRRWDTAQAVMVGLLSIGLIFQIILTGDVLQWVNTWRNLFPGLNLPPVPFRFDNGNSWAAYLIPLFFLQLGIFFTTRRRIWRWLLVLWMAWTLVLVYFCSSRGGMIGLGAAGATFLIIERKVVWEWLRPAWEKLRRRRWLVYGLGVAVFIGAAAAGWMVFQSFEAHPTHGSFGFGSRTPFWIPSWNAFLESPIWGNGFYTEVNFYMARHSIPPEGLYYHSHNLFLDLLQGGGIILALAAGMVLFALVKSLERARKNSTRNNLPLTMAALPVLTGFLAHSLFDSLYWLPMVSLPLMVIFGSALATDEGKNKFRLPSAQITAVLTILAAWGLYYVQQPYIRAINEADGSDWQGTAALMEQSVKRLPQSPLFNREAGYAWAEAAGQGDSETLDKAVERFEAAAAQDPNFAVNWLNLGAYLRESGNLSGAREALETASEKAGKWGLAWLNLGEVCETMGDESCARQAYLKTLTLEPDWAADPYWRENSLRLNASAAAKAILHAKKNQEPLDLENVIQQPYMGPVLITAREKIKAGELEEADRLLKLAPTLFIGRELELVELHWLEAELEAARGDLDLAAELGQAARLEFETYRLNDAVFAGVYVYGPGIYQLPTLGIDLVPQVTWMQYPGDWEERMEKLSKWQE